MADSCYEGRICEMFGPLTLKTAENADDTLNSECKCLLCEDSFNLTLSLPLFLMHIFEVHSLVIEDVQHIENLQEYISYWRGKFKEAPMENIVPSVDINSTHNKYYLLSSLLKEDRVLRHNISLDHTVKVQEFERTDTNFQRNCLFCRLAFEGKRTDYLDHLSSQHNLQLGNPHNLVFIDELIDKIDSKLKELQCIYCDKTFPQWSILKEHMRKKLHKRINARNRDYDKFYMVNYLEMDRKWKSIQREDDNYAVSAGQDVNSDDEYSDWNEKDVLITCLFCDHRETDINLLCLHMDGDHNFDFAEATKNIDFYQKIKLVNYIRKRVHSCKCPYCDAGWDSMEKLRRHLNEDYHYKLPDLTVFNQPEFYFPTYENDAFLYCIDDVED